MKYHKVKDKIFMTVLRPDGYNGAVIDIGLAIHEGSLFEVAPFGCHKSAVLPTVVSEAEARWYINNDLHCKKYYKPKEIN